MKHFKTVRCENCGGLYQVEYIRQDPNYFYLKLKYSSCPLCYHPRTNEKPRPGQFQCKDCNIIFTLTPKRRPIAGICASCYMKKRRGNVNHEDRELI